MNGSSSSIRNLNLTNVNVTGSSNVGGLVGSVGAGVNTVTVTGNVTGLGNNVGGVAGSAFVGGGGNLSGFFRVGFSGNVNAGTPTWVDLGNGTLHRQPQAGGTGGFNVGGLVGVTTVSVSRSYAYGTVTSEGRYSANIGGLVGWLLPVDTNIGNNALVANSMSAATVYARGDGLDDANPIYPGSRGGYFVGGLIGQNGNLGAPGSNYSIRWAASAR